MSESDTITIAGFEFNVPVRYTEGHQLTAGEASALNQTFHENLRNNFAKRVKEAVEAGTFDLGTFQQQFDEYAGQYEFGVRQAGGGGGRAPADPVKREAYRMAALEIELRLKAKGKTIGPKGDVTRAQISATVPKYLDQHPEILDRARAAVEEAKSRAGSEPEDDLDSMLADSSEAPAEDRAAA